ncbi:hypothetical protein OROHE_021664 [Orobanche hederae]
MTNQSYFTPNSSPIRLGKQQQSVQWHNCLGRSSTQFRDGD